MSSIHDPGALFQIAEPSAPTATPRAPGRGIGIDLGTTHSLVALAPPESLLAAGLEHRFEAGEVAGHTAGNLLLGAMMRECGGDLIAVLDALGEALGTVGRVLPAAVNPVTLLGETSEGWVRGQVEVASTTKLVRLGFEPADPMVPVPPMTITRMPNLPCSPVGSVAMALCAVQALPFTRDYR